LKLLGTSESGSSVARNPAMEGLSEKLTGSSVKFKSCMSAAVDASVLGTLLVVSIASPGQHHLLNHPVQQLERTDRSAPDSRPTAGGVTPAPQQTEQLPADLLKGLHYLHTIDLTDNELQEIPAHVFHHAPLLNLVLKDNRIFSIHPDCLPNNSNITWLDLSGNHLIKFPMAQLQSLSHLKVLHLSQNKLEELPVGCLIAHPALERLHVDQNKIQSLDVKGFCCSGNLTHILLQKNRLDSLPPTVFQGLKRLEYMDLSDNRLQFLLSGTLDINTSWVELTFNPWHCDAKKEYLWRKLTMESLQSEPKCTTPENLKDCVIATLTRKEMGLPE
ncbi:hypothetical protein cypCar_00020225, partial [Cyprinus carpio]